MITDQNIQFEAFKMHEQHPENTPEQNWECAKEILRIFPDKKIESPSFCNHHTYTGGKGYCVKMTDQSESWPGQLMLVSCRETFEKFVKKQMMLPGQQFETSDKNIMIDNTHMYYLHTTQQNVLKAALLLRQVETEYLHLQELSKFNSCNSGRCNDHLIKIVYSPFWLQHTMRFSFFTMVLRAGTLIYGDGPEWSSKQIRDSFFGCGTLSAVVNDSVVNACMKFLEGYVDYKGAHDPVGTSTNWILTFQNSANCDLLRAA